MSSINQHLQPGEKILYRTGPTRIGLYVALFAFVLVALVAAGGYQQTGQGIYLALGALIGLPLLYYTLQQWIFVSSNEYVLTNRRVLRQSGILTRRSVTAYLDKLNNVEHSISIWGRLLGYGDVEIDTASETGTTLFRQVPRPLEFQRAILGAAEEVRASRFGGGPPSSPISGADRLRQLKSLLDDGLISQQEYEQRRSKIVEEL